METSAISHRVADFLAKHAPFHGIDEADLLLLANTGRVRFFEPYEYILWQGEPHRLQVFVIQQGTVSLWDESGQQARLRDLRGAGDMLGLERYNDARACLHSARSETDVVIYAFPASDFEALVLKYPPAMHYVKAESRGLPEYQPSDGRPDLSRVLLRDLVGSQPLALCPASDTIAQAAARLLGTRSQALLIVDAERRPRAALTADTIVSWVADGGADARQPVRVLQSETPAILGWNASAADGLLAMSAARVNSLAITHDGTADGRAELLVTPRDLSPLFGDHPIAVLRALRLAAGTADLREVNHRARMFVLDRLNGPSSVEWLSRFSFLVDTTILERVVQQLELDSAQVCWCFAGSSGRAESLTKLAPMLLAITDDSVPVDVGRRWYRQVLDGLHECGYLPRLDLPFDAGFYVASLGTWQARFRSWVRDPIWQEAYRARSLFDVRPVAGPPWLWRALEAEILQTVNNEFVHVLANDCLSSLPPLTFFQDAVVDSFGEHTTTFRLEESAVRPLVDVGRVFALAAREVLGRSTLERFEAARVLLPAQEAIFREASDTFRIVLWQQGRVGISQETRGADLPPALLSRYDRQVLKSGFRSILRLLEYTANLEWLQQP